MSEDLNLKQLEDEVKIGPVEGLVRSYERAGTYTGAEAG